MLVNGRALAQLCTDDSYEAKLSGTLFLLQVGFIVIKIGLMSSISEMIGYHFNVDISYYP